MALAQVRMAQGTASATPNTSVSFSSLPAVGNLIIVTTSAWAASSEAAMATGTCVDNQGHGNYTRVTDLDFVTSNVHISKFYMVVTASSGTFTITQSISVSATISLQIEEYSGNETDLAQVLHTSASVANITSGTAIDSGNLVISVNDALIHASVTSTLTDPTYSMTGGLLTLTQEVTDNSTTQEITSAMRVISSSGTYTGAFTGSIAAGGAEYGIIAAAFNGPLTPPSAALTGTVTASITEADIV